MAHDRRRFLKGAGAAGLAGTAGCVGGFGGDGGGDGSGVDVGMVYATGGLGDKSFNDMAQQGAIQAEEEYGIGYEEAEPSANADFSGAQRDFAEQGEFDLISCIGFAQGDSLSENAPEYPDQDWIIVDESVEEDNVRSYLFDEHKGSFQVGLLAGLLTTTELDAGAGETKPDSTTVGFVGGVEAPLIQKFEAGFVAGVEHADTGTEVVSSYVGDFNDTAGGRETALSMYQDQDADVIYHAAGATGVGVFEAAQSRGRYAIGVDADQSESESDYADVILASMVKRVDTAVFTAIESVVDDEFEGGEEVFLGLEDDGVEAVYGQELGDEIPDDVKERLDESRQAIIDGEIEVPEQP